MSNSLRGAVPFEVDGAAYTLRLTTNAQVRYEDAADEDVVAAVQAIFKGRRPTARLRRLLWAGVSPALTEEEAGEIMDALGRQETAALIGKAVRLAMPELAEGNAPKAAKGAAKTETESAGA